MIIQTDRKRKFLFTKFTVNFLVLYDHVPFNCFDGFVSFEPLSQTFEMNSTHCAAAVAWTYHRIELFILVVNHTVVIV